MQPWAPVTPGADAVEKPAPTADADPVFPEEPALPVPPPARDVPPTMTRSGRMSRPPRRLIAAVGLFLQTFSPLPIEESTVLHLLQPDIEAHSEPHPLALFSEHLVAFVGSDPDTMTLDEAPDREQFIEVMRKELHDHVKRKH
jgi:hypothetical protein